MPTVEEVVALYATAWNEPDAAARRRTLEGAWADRGVYSDPTAHVEGRDALVEHIAGFQSQMPGARIGRTTAVDAHGTVARFGWHLVQADGTEALVGLDFVELAEDGRIARVVGFFGPLD